MAVLVRFFNPSCMEVSMGTIAQPIPSRRVMLDPWLVRLVGGAMLTQLVRKLFDALFERF